MKIIKIGALWCPGCLIVNNSLKKVLQIYNNLEIIEYDYDFNEDEVSKYNVGKILPVLIFVDENNNEISRLIGERSFDEICNEIKRVSVL